MSNAKLLITTTGVILLMSCMEVYSGQPRWNIRYTGESMYGTSTETWEECGLLCTRNFQWVDQVEGECLFWTWINPSPREYSKLCRFYESEGEIEDNGATISGASGCYSLHTC